MPLEFRDLKEEVEAQGYSLEVTSKGHYWVITPSGGKLITFAVSHKKNSRGEIYDSYVGKIRKAIKENQS
jgi:hypothetical protein